MRFRRPSTVKAITAAVLIGAPILCVYVAATNVYLWDEERDWIPLAEQIPCSPGGLHLPLRGLLHPEHPAVLLPIPPWNA